MKSVFAIIGLVMLLAPTAFAETTYLEPTQCDLLAAHPDDPDRNAPGLEQDEIDYPKAEAACMAVVASGALDARAHYLLGRVLFYQQKYKEGAAHVGHAAAMGYRQAIFVLGYIHTLERIGPADFCKAGKLLRQAVSLEHPWSGYHFVDKALNGSFEGCEFEVTDAQLKDAMHMAATQITTVASDGRVEALRARLAEHLETAE